MGTTILVALLFIEFIFGLFGRKILLVISKDAYRQHVIWNKYDISFFKVNIDGSHIGGHSNFGCFVQDNQGNFIRGFIYNI